MAQQLDVRYVSCYTQGSAARELNPVQPFKTLRLPKVRKMKKRVLRVDPIALAGIIMSVFLVCSMISGIVELTQLRKEAAIMHTYVQTLQAENDALTEEYRMGLDLESVRKTAKALGLVPREQVKHVIIEMPVEEAPAQVTVWEQICTFLAGLFA